MTVPTDHAARTRAGVFAKQDPDFRRERSSHAAHSRHRKPAAVDRRVAALAEHVRRVVDTFPPLTEAQRDKLRAAFRPALPEGEAAALLRPTDGVTP